MASSSCVVTFAVIHDRTRLNDVQMSLGGQNTLAYPFPPLDVQQGIHIHVSTFARPIFPVGPLFGQLPYVISTRESHLLHGADGRTRRHEGPVASTYFRDYNNENEMHILISVPNSCPVSFYEPERDSYDNLFSILCKNIIDTAVMQLRLGHRTRDPELLDYDYDLPNPRWLLRWQPQ